MKVFKQSIYIYIYNQTFVIKNEYILLYYDTKWNTEYT